MPRFRVWLFVALAGCAQQPAVAPEPAPEKPGELPPLPASFVNTPGCPRCLAVTLVLRPDGSYLVRERLGESEFYDFGRWRRAGAALELVGGRDAPRRYGLREQLLDSQGATQGGDLKRAPRAEALRGPFRMVGVYDGDQFRECLTGVAWKLTQTRAAEALQHEYRKHQKPTLVSLDAQFEGTPEQLRVLRPATLLDTSSCPS